MTQLIHGKGANPDEVGSRAHAFPIFQTSTFRFKNAEEGARIFEGKVHQDAYSRVSNPNHRLLEERLCILEGGQAAQVFDSGMSAIKTLLLSLVDQRDEIIAHRNLYGGTYGFLKDLQRFGIKVIFVDARDPENVDKVLSVWTKLIFLETPTNPTLEICDFKTVKELACKQGRSDVLVVVDNTFATPVNQRPLLNGADVVIQSMTKYINGFGTHTGGAIISSEQVMARIWERFNASGGMMDPEVASRITTNMLTLYDRMKRHNQNGGTVAGSLLRHPQVNKVYYPGLPSHPGHDLAKRLMTDFGGMVSFELKDEKKAEKFLDELAQNREEGKGIITQAVSLGSVDTLVCSPALSTHHKIPSAERAAVGIRDGLIRLSVGIENVEDIIYSLDRAFQAIK